MLYLNEFDDAYQEKLDKDKKSAVNDDDSFEFTKGFSAGIDQTAALGGGFLALAGSAVGNDEWFYNGLDYYNEQMALAAENEAEVGRIEDIEGMDDFFSWLSYTAGQALPSLATSVIGGGVGGACEVLEQPCR